MAALWHTSPDTFESPFTVAETGPLMHAAASGTTDVEQAQQPATATDGGTDDDFAFLLDEPDVTPATWMPIVRPGYHATGMPTAERAHACDRSLVFVMCDGPGFGRCVMDYVHAILLAAATNRSLTVIDQYWNYRCAVDRGLDCYFVPPANPLQLNQPSAAMQAVEGGAWSRGARAVAEELTNKPVWFCSPKELAQRLPHASSGPRGRVGRAEPVDSPGIDGLRAVVEWNRFEVEERDNQGSDADGDADADADVDADADADADVDGDDRRRRPPMPYLTDENAFDLAVPWVLCNRDHIGPMDRWIRTQPATGLLLATRRVLAQVWQLRPEVAQFIASRRQASSALAPLLDAPVYVGIHIRSGDKRSQRKLLHAPHYMRRAVALLENWAAASAQLQQEAGADFAQGSVHDHLDGRGTRERVLAGARLGAAIFVASDNLTEIAFAREQCPDYRIASIHGAARERVGGLSAVATARTSALAHDQSAFNRLPFSERGKQTLLLLLELQLLAEATWFVGTFSSNLGRLIQGLRWTHAPQTAYSLDAPWQLV